MAKISIIIISEPLNTISGKEAEAALSQIRAILNSIVYLGVKSVRLITGYLFDGSLPQISFRPDEAGAFRFNNKTRSAGNRPLTNSEGISFDVAN